MSNWYKKIYICIHTCIVRAWEDFTSCVEWRSDRWWWSRWIKWGLSVVDDADRRRVSTLPTMTKISFINVGLCSLSSVNIIPLKPSIDQSFSHVSIIPYPPCNYVLDEDLFVLMIKEGSKCWWCCWQKKSEHTPNSDKALFHQCRVVLTLFCQHNLSLSQTICTHQSPC